MQAIDSETGSLWAEAAEGLSLPMRLPDDVPHTSEAVQEALRSAPCEKGSLQHEVRLKLVKSLHA